MARERRTSLEDPRRHTAIIGDVPTMWQKLAWDVQQFDDIQRSFPDDPEPLSFAAINVCIAATSLADWTKAAVVSRSRDVKAPVHKNEVEAKIHSLVPHQKMCEAIANTAKHSRFAEGEWTSGAVSIEWWEGDEDSPPGYVLQHLHAKGRYKSLALSAFGSLEANWWDALISLDFPLPHDRLAFEWRQRRLRATFGHRQRAAIEAMDD